MKVIKEYSCFNERRFSNPWVALVDKDTAKVSFAEKVGGYTGGYNCGEAGKLYIKTPIEGAVYAYGQKDNRGNKGEMVYIKVVNGEFVEIEKTNLITELEG